MSDTARGRAIYIVEGDKAKTRGVGYVEAACVEGDGRNFDAAVRI